MRAQEVKIYDSGNKPVEFQIRHAADVTKSDTTIFPAGTLYIGTTGNVSVRTADGDDVVFVNVPDAFILPVLVDMVYDATTASDIIVMR